MEKIKQSVSYIMAGYNEAGSAEEAISTVWKVLDEAFEDYEIVLVDDGSKDNTLAIMKACAEKLPHIRVLENGINMNYGCGVLKGLLAAEKEWAVYDAFDLEMHPADFVEKFREMEPDTDVVVYERITYEAVPWRKFASLLNRAALHFFYPFLMRGTPILNHVQMFRTSIIRQILPMSRSPIFFSAELVFRAKLKGLKVVNVPIKFNCIDGVRGGAFGHLHDIIWGLLDMIRFRWHLWRGKI